jgi:hypothetical protein
VQNGLFFSKVSQDPLAFSGDSSVEIISSESILRGPELENALSGLGNMPLSLESKSQLERDLLCDEHRTLYRLKRPIIFVFTFPNGETRHFILSNSGVLLEKDDFWLKYFTFIIKKDGLYTINWANDQNEILTDEGEFVWSYDTPNFTHFLVDSVAPLAFFCKIDSALKKLTIPQFSQTPRWQDEFMQGFGPRRFYIPKNSSSGHPKCIIFKPQALFLPVITSALARILAVRDFVRDIWNERISCAKLDRIPIYLTRNDQRAARIRNSRQIKELVSGFGGFSIDPSKLTAPEKLRLFNLPGVFIAEGSGTLNICIFASHDSRAVVLTDHNIISDPSFMVGGWPYFHFISSRASFLQGTDSMALAGSPLSSCSYSIPSLKNMIADSILK